MCGHCLATIGFELSQTGAVPGSHTVGSSVALIVPFLILVSLVETGYTTQSRVLSSSHGCCMSEVGLFPKCWKHVGPLSVPSGGSFCLSGWYSLLRRCSMSVLDCVRLRVYGLEIMYNFPYWVYGLRKNTNLRLMKWMPRFLFSCLHYAMDINQLARVSVADGRQERTIQWTLTHALHKRIVVTRP